MSIWWSPIFGCWHQLTSNWQQKLEKYVALLCATSSGQNKNLTISAPPFSYPRKTIELHKQVRKMPPRAAKRILKVCVQFQAQRSLASFFKHAYEVNLAKLDKIRRVLFQKLFPKTKFSMLRFAGGFSQNFWILRLLSLNIRPLAVNDPIFWLKLVNQNYHNFV